MTVPYYVNEHDGEQRQALVRTVFKPSNQGNCLTGITQARSNFRASPWLRRTIKCPECGGEHVRPCIRVDEYGGREWIDNSCETCGHKLSLEEIGRHVVN